MYGRIVKRYKIYIKTFLPKDSHDYKERYTLSLGTFRSQKIFTIKFIVRNIELLCTGQGSVVILLSIYNFKTNTK